MTTPVRLGVVLAATSFVLASVARAQNIGMPAGARQWIHLSGNWVADGICCDDAVGGVGSLPSPSPNYVHDSGTLSTGGVVYANADSTANRLRSSYYDIKTTAIFFYNSLLDTYTIHGPPGTEGQPVSVTLHFHEVGTIFVNAHQTGTVNVGSASAQLKVGSWNPDTDPALSEQFRVYTFPPSDQFSATALLPLANYGSTTPTMAVNHSVDQPLTRTVGTPFDIAFCLVVGGNGGGNMSASTAPGDAEYITATIDWELPPGYTLTSVLGWTDPDAPACDPIDFNADGLSPDTADIDDFLSVFSGGACSTGTCGDIDFNNDGLFPDTSDIDVLLRVFSGGPCA
ncbi:MAG: hypothetical protein U0637_01260 [Phycisphaerales bacterium]